VAGDQDANRGPKGNAVAPGLGQRPPLAPRAHAPAWARTFAKLRFATSTLPGDREPVEGRRSGASRAGVPKAELGHEEERGQPSRRALAGGGLTEGSFPSP